MKKIIDAMNGHRVLLFSTITILITVVSTAGGVFYKLNDITDQNARFRQEIQDELHIIVDRAIEGHSSNVNAHPFLNACIQKEVLNIDKQLSDIKCDISDNHKEIMSILKK